MEPCSLSNMLCVTNNAHMSTGTIGTLRWSFGGHQIELAEIKGVAVDVARESGSRAPTAVICRGPDCSVVQTVSVLQRRGPMQHQSLRSWWTSILCEFPIALGRSEIRPASLTVRWSGKVSEAAFLSGIEEALEERMSGGKATSASHPGWRQRV